MTNTNSRLLIFAANEPIAGLEQLAEMDLGRGRCSQCGHSKMGGTISHQNTISVPVLFFWGCEPGPIIRVIQFRVNPEISCAVLIIAGKNMKPTQMGPQLFAL